MLSSASSTILNRLAPDRLRLPHAFNRIGDEVDKMEERLGRLDAAREAIWRSDRRKTAAKGFARMQRNQIGLKPLITKESAKWPISRRSMISEA